VEAAHHRHHRVLQRHCWKKRQGTDDKMSNDKMSNDKMSNNKNDEISKFKL
jgi:hypothetical protein